MNDALLVGMKGGVSGALAARRGRAVGRLLLKEEALLEDMKDVLFAEESVLVEMEEAGHVLLAEDAVLVEHVLFKEETVLVEMGEVEHVLLEQEAVLVEMGEVEHVLLEQEAVLVETKDVMLEEDVLFREERKDVLLVGMKGAVLVGMKDALLVVKGGVSVGGHEGRAAGGKG
ncbi:hypothetical protein PF011_g12184 [Phytophthora fragariae]|nr:hypothetical protein PF011_g12184 [Phytophthora fragariae]